MRMKQTFSLDAEIVADLQALVGQLKAAAVRGGDQAEGVSLSSVCEDALRREIKRINQSLAGKSA